MAELHDWLNKKAAEKRRVSFSNVPKYKTRKATDGIFIRKRKYRNDLVFPARLSARMSQGRIYVVIRPSAAGTILLSIFSSLLLLGIGIAIKTAVRDFGQAILGLSFFALTFGFLIHILLIWPVFDARKWIERELGLNREIPPSPERQ